MFPPPSRYQTSSTSANRTNKSSFIAVRRVRGRHFRDAPARRYSVSQKVLQTRCQSLQCSTLTLYAWQGHGLLDSDSRQPALSCNAKRRGLNRKVHVSATLETHIPECVGFGSHGGIDPLRIPAWWRSCGRNRHNTWARSGRRQARSCIRALLARRPRHLFVFRSIEQQRKRSRSITTAKSATKIRVLLQPDVSRKTATVI